MLENKKVLGIITEYDPFHNGHFYQFDSAKKACGADYVIVVMSGPYMQRGSLAMFSPSLRCRMALENGIDLVLEMPVLFSLRDAYGFARGGISILDSLGVVDYLSFGCESGEVQSLYQIADFLETRDLDLHNYFLQKSSSGKSYVQLQSEIIGEKLGLALQRIYESPNNMLGLNYIRVLKQLDSRINVIPIKRYGSHNNKSVDPHSPSASFIRHAIKQGNLKEAFSCLTKESKALVEEAVFSYKVNFREFNEESILEKIRNSSLEQLQEIPGVAEGFENRVKKLVVENHSIKDLLLNLKSRRYTLSRLKRMLSYIDLDVRKHDLETHSTPSFARVMGYRKTAEPLLKAILANTRGMQIISSPAKENLDNFFVEKKAYEKWSLAAKYTIDYNRTGIIKI